MCFISSHKNSTLLYRLKSHVYGFFPIFFLFFFCKSKKLVHRLFRKSNSSSHVHSFDFWLLIYFLSSPLHSLFLPRFFLLTTALIGIVLSSLWIQSNRRSSRHSFFVALHALWFGIIFTIKSMSSLMNSSNYFINIQFLKYISVCFDLRDKLYPN